ncbi:MAG: hypothetical protein EON57_03995 [Alphaproteobacteria bacterium]|nr:MAG: hypothetical protein EON57_03995 [Alphaproteobacteria bacterium]
MSILRTAITAATLARRVATHPAVLAVAPMILNPKVQAAARDATLTGAFKAGQLARKILNSTRR